MTKRALIIISVLILLPLVITLVAWTATRIKNPVVAEWDDDMSGITYKGESYLPVGKVGERLFSVGKYLGKIGSSRYGAPLYLVKGDSLGYLCYAAEGEQLVLLSKNGKPLEGDTSGMPDKIKLGKSTTDVKDEISLLLSLDLLTDPEKVTDDDDMPIVFSTKKYKGKYTKYKLWEYRGDGAIGIDSGARLYHMDETGNWYYVTAADAVRAESEEGATYFTYTARPLRDMEALALIERLSEGKTAEESTAQ